MRTATISLLRRFSRAVRDQHLSKLKEVYRQYFARTGVAAIVFPATMIPPSFIGEDVEVSIGGKKVPFQTAVARNIAPGSTAGLPGLVIAAGMTPGGLPTFVRSRHWGRYVDRIFRRGTCADTDGRRSCDAEIPGYGHMPRLGRRKTSGHDLRAGARDAGHCMIRSLWMRW